MDKYICKLISSMWRYFSLHEIRETITDFYFMLKEQGMDGRQEGEIAAEFGKPEEIVLSMRKERLDDRQGISVVFRYGLCFVSIFVYVLFLYRFCSKQVENFEVFFVYGIVVSAICLWNISGGESSVGFISNRKKLHLYWIAGQTAAAVLMALYLFLTLAAIPHMIYTMGKTGVLSDLGQLVRNIEIIFLILIFCVAAFGIYHWKHNHNYWMQAVLIQCIGLAGSIIMYDYFLAQAIELFWHYTLLFPMAFSVIAAVIFGIYCWKKEKSIDGCAD